MDHKNNKLLSNSKDLHLFAIKSLDTNKLQAFIGFTNKENGNFDFTQIDVLGLQIIYQVNEFNKWTDCDLETYNGYNMEKRIVYK